MMKKQLVDCLVIQALCLSDGCREVAVHIAGDIAKYLKKAIRKLLQGAFVWKFGS